jgi:hypothetical protein
MHSVVQQVFLTTTLTDTACNLLLVQLLVMQRERHRQLSMHLIAIYKSPQFAPPGGSAMCLTWCGTTLHGAPAVKLLGSFSFSLPAAASALSSPAAASPSLAPLLLSPAATAAASPSAAGLAGSSTSMPAGKMQRVVSTKLSFATGANKRR